MNDRRRLEIALLAMRVGVFVVLLVWTLDKFVNPDHAAGVFAGFYGLPGLGAQVMYAVGAAELLLILAFLAGVWKTWTYGGVLVIHAISTLASYEQYLDPYAGANILFFAAIPMLAACLALFLLRAQDRLLVLGR